MSTLNSLKDALTKELANGQVDYGLVLALAADIAKMDEDNVRFSVDASHVYRLGIELVSKQETAVAEIIKNAYDADATEVNLTFENSSLKGGTLSIIDNGVGMSRNRLIDGFMRISTQDKVAFPTSAIHKRQRAGRKGIGRFAAQRLGARLTIDTQQRDEDFSLRIEINWDDFEGGKDLNLISNQIRKCAPLSTAGTRLKIINLRDVWTESQIQRTFRFVSELLQPFPLSLQETDANHVDPGFKVTFSRIQDGKHDIVASEEQSIFAHALAIISCEVDVDGMPILNVSSEKYDLDIRDRKINYDPRLKNKNGLSDGKFPELAGIRFSAYYFITDELPQGTRTLARAVLNRQGGIRIYRNGFRVLPYGEAYDDWLGLQRSSALRELLPPHHNSNFLGFVEIQDLSGVKFEETASREGLIENEAFLHLQDFVYRSLMTGVIELAQARNKKLFAGKDKKAAEPKQSPKETASSIAAFLRDAANSALLSGPASPTASTNADNNGDDDPVQPDASAFNSFAEKVEQLGLATESVLEENGMLRVLASLGLTIGEFTHEVRHAMAALSANIALISQNISADDPLSAPSISMRENMELLRSYVRYFDNAVIENSHRDLQVHELRDLVGEFSDIVRPTLDRQKIDIVTEFTGYDLFTRPMHKSEWASIFLNLFTNSLKAIHRAGNKGAISIVCGVVDDKLYIEFSDNGDGIAQHNRGRIFDAFFTTSAPANVMSPDSDKLVGTGLGMKIVRDIVEGSLGEIELVSAPAGYNTCFRIEVPKAKDEEIGDAKY